VSKIRADIFVVKQSVKQTVKHLIKHAHNQQLKSNLSNKCRIPFLSCQLLHFINQCEFKKTKQALAFVQHQHNQQLIFELCLVFQKTHKKVSHLYNCIGKSFIFVGSI